MPLSSGTIVKHNAKTINVIGKTSLEAVDEVKNFIDQAVVNGLEEVKAVLEEMLREDKIYIERVISYSNAGIIQLIRKQGELISEEYV